MIGGITLTKTFLLGSAGSTALGDSIVTMISFVLLFWLLKKFAWKPLMNMLDERERTINADLEKAQSARETAERDAGEAQQQLREVRERANELLTKAQVEGNDILKTMRHDAQDEAQRTRQQAQKEMNAEKERMFASLRGDVSEMSVLIAEKIIGRELKTEDQDRLIEEFINGLEN